MVGTHVYLWPIRVDVWQKPSQYCNYPPIKITKERLLPGHCGFLMPLKKQAKKELYCVILTTKGENRLHCCTMEVIKMYLKNR